MQSLRKFSRPLHPHHDNAFTPDVPNKCTLHLRQTR